MPKPEQPMTLEEFGQMAKTKYPEGVTSAGVRYADIPNVEFAKMIIGKYPVYESWVIRPEAKPEPSKPSFWEEIKGFAKKTATNILPNLFTPGAIPAALVKSVTQAPKIAEPVGEITGARAAAELAYPTIEAIASKVQPKRLLEPAKGAVLKTAEERGIGRGLEALGGYALETAGKGAIWSSGLGVALPGGQVAAQFAQRFPTIARYLNYARVGGTYGGIFFGAEALQKGKEAKEVLKETGKGTAYGAASAVILGLATEGILRAGKNIGSLFSGTPRKAIEQAFKSPDAVGKAVSELKGDPVKVRTVVSDATGAMDQLSVLKNEEYRQAMLELEKTNPKLNKVIAKGYNEVKTSIGTVMKQKNLVKILPKTDYNKLQEFQQLVDNWDDFTPSGIRDLNEAMNNRIGPDASVKWKALVKEAQKVLGKIIEKDLPIIAEMNAKYSGQIEEINSLRAEFGSERMSDTSKLKRLLSIFKPGGEYRMQLIKVLGEKTGNQLIDELAAATMLSWTPQYSWMGGVMRGGAGTTGAAAAVVGGKATALPWALLSTPFFSPRVVGAGARTAGRIVPLLENVAINYALPYAESILAKSRK